MNSATELSITIRLLYRVLPCHSGIRTCAALMPHMEHIWSSALPRFVHCDGVTGATEIGKNNIPPWEFLRMEYCNQNAFGERGGCLFAKKKTYCSYQVYIHTYNGSLIFFIDGCCDVQKVTICCFALHMSGRMTGPIFQAHHAHWPSKIHMPTSRSTMQSCISKKQSQSHSILFNVTFLLSYFPCFERPRQWVDELCISNFKASETLQQQRAGHASWTGKNW